MSNPLEGIRVLEIGSWIAAPAAGRILQAMGAEVVKVEPPSGDPMRGVANPARRRDMNPIFEITNAGKRSIGVNLKHPKARQLLLRLVGDADVLLTNLQSDALEAMGISYESIRESCPKVVFCHVVGYTDTGPLANRPAFDGAAFWAASGQTYLASEGLESPLFPRAGTGDHATSMAAVARICSALYARERSGKGSHVSTALAGVGSFGLSWDLANHAWLSEVAAPPVRTRASNPLNNYYQLGDGRWIILVNLQSDVVWPRLCVALECTDLLDDARFRTARERAIHADALVDLLDNAFAGFTESEIARRLDEAAVVWAPVNGPADVLDSANPNTLDANINGEERRIPAVPLRISGSVLPEGGHVPEVGEHTETVLLEAGLDWDWIVSAKDEGLLL